MHFIFMTANKKVAIIFLLVLSIIIAGELFLLTKLDSKKKTVNTPIITSFSGIIDKIESKTIFLKVNSDGSSSNKPLHKIIIKPSSILETAPFGVPYLYKTINVDSPRKVKLESLRKGDYIQVEAIVGPRSVASYEFEASKVTVPPPTIIMNGRIKAIQGDKVMAIGFPVAFAGKPITYTDDKEYTFTVTKNTEIAKNILASGDAPAQREKLSLLNLKENMSVTVYADSDLIKNSSANALLITQNLP